MVYPQLLNFEHDDEYLDRYRDVYCTNPIITFDGFQVRFRRADYFHLFCKEEYEGGPRNVFVPQRAQRMDWIKTTLEDNAATLKFGWDRRTRGTMFDRRVALVQGNYTVTIQFEAADSARIVTAFVMDVPANVSNLLLQPTWEQDKMTWRGK